MKRNDTLRNSLDRIIARVELIQGITAFFPVDYLTEESVREGIDTILEDIRSDLDAMSTQVETETETETERTERTDTPCQVVTLTGKSNGNGSHRTNELERIRA